MSQNLARIIKRETRIYILQIQRHSKNPTTNVQNVPQCLTQPYFHNLQIEKKKTAVTRG